MPINGRFREYYWNLRQLLDEKESILDKKHPDYNFPEDDDTVYYARYLEGCLVFRDGSRLKFEFTLEFDETYTVVEKRYFYGYFDARGVRIFQYDNSPHHEYLRTYPHHLHKGRRPKRGKDKAFNIDIPKVSFAAVLAKIEDVYLR